MESVPYTKKKKKVVNFIDTPQEDAYTAFVKYLGMDCTWFAEMLKEIKEEWIDKGSNVTEILIRENAPTMIGAIKAYVPFSSVSAPSSQSMRIISKEEIIDIVKLFCDVDQEGEGEASKDFSFFVMGLGIFRGNYSVDSSGVGVSLRYHSFEILSLEEIGYPSWYREHIENLVDNVSVSTPNGVIDTGVVRKGGVILHVGATGTGKTTSMAAEIGHFAEHSSGTIITYERPIEKKFIATLAPVRQYEIGKDIKASKDYSELEEITRHLLRNNPSVLLFGEARNNDEIRMILETGLKGHLVVSTIHASNVSEALTTISSVVEGEEYIAATAIRAIVAHRLYMNNEGKIIPLFELWIPDEVDRKSISKKDIESVTKALTGPGSRHKTGMSFAQYISYLTRQKVLSSSEAQELSRTFDTTNKVET